MEAITGQDVLYKKTVEITDAAVVAFVQECISLEEESKEGLTAYLALPDRESWLLAGAGSSFELKGKVWKVTKIDQQFAY